MNVKRFRGRGACLLMNDKHPFALMKSACYPTDSSTPNRHETARPARGLPGTRSARRLTVLSSRICFLCSFNRTPMHGPTKYPMHAAAIEFFSQDIYVHEFEKLPAPITERTSV
jgi:hypothetical protein